MLSKVLKATGMFILVLGIAGSVFAGDSKTIQISAHIESQDGLSITIHNVDADTDEWDSTPVSSIDFGTLTYDSNLGIFLPNHYCVIDVGVLSNVSNWTVSHTVDSSFTNGTDNLDHNVVVTFVKTEQVDTDNDGTPDSTSDTEITQVSYANSIQSFTKTQLSGGWLRIYYGIATGELDQYGNKIEPADTSPITIDKSAGNYTGSITITLTP